MSDNGTSKKPVRPVILLRCTSGNIIPPPPNWINEQKAAYRTEWRENIKERKINEWLNGYRIKKIIHPDKGGYIVQRRVFGLFWIQHNTKGKGFLSHEAASYWLHRKLSSHYDYKKSQEQAGLTTKNPLPYDRVRWKKWFETNDRSEYE